jgi:hypothetical protein
VPHLQRRSHSTMRRCVLPAIPIRLLQRSTRPQRPQPAQYSLGLRICSILRIPGKTTHFKKAYQGTRLTCLSMFASTAASSAPCSTASQPFDAVMHATITTSILARMVSLRRFQPLFLRERLELRVPFGLDMCR